MNGVSGTYLGMSPFEYWEDSVRVLDAALPESPGTLLPLWIGSIEFLFSKTSDEPPEWLG